MALFDDVWRDYTRETYTYNDKFPRTVCWILMHRSNRYDELLDGERLPKAVDRTRLEEVRLTDAARFCRRLDSRNRCSTSPMMTFSKCLR